MTNTRSTGGIHDAFANARPVLYRWVVPAALVLYSLAELLDGHTFRSGVVFWVGAIVCAEGWRLDATGKARTPGVPSHLPIVRAELGFDRGVGHDAFAVNV